MDLYVKLQGIKYSFKKIQGCFCKIPGADEFTESINLFSIQKGVEYVHGLIDPVHGAPIHWSMRLNKWWPLATGSTAGI
jgi:hypothetical protein